MKYFSGGVRRFRGAFSVVFSANDRVWITAASALGRVRRAFQLLTFVGCVFLPAIASAQVQFFPVHSGTEDLWGVISGPGGLVTVGANGSILQSLDGKSWNRQNSGTTEWLLSVTYGKDHYIAVGDHGTILSSIDGSAWSRIAGGLTNQRLNRVAFQKGTFVAVGEAETILTSADGQTWKIANQGGTHWLRGLAFSTYGQWIAGGEGGVIYLSPDGLSWKKNSFVAPTAIEAFQELSEFFYTPPSAGDAAGYYSVGYAGAYGKSGVLSVSFILHAESIATEYGRIDQVIDESLAPIDSDLRVIDHGFSVFGDHGVSIQGAIPSERHVYSLPTSSNIYDSVFAGGSTFLVGSQGTILRTTPPDEPIFSNISTRGYVGTGEQVLIAGTIVTGNKPMRILVRALGQTLRDYGVNNVLSDPVIEARNGPNELLATSGPWAESAGADDVVEALTELGAKPLDPAKKDAALVLTVSPGAYTFIVKSRSDKKGIALVDIFDLTPPGDDHSTHLSNVSTRGFVGPGEQVLIAGVIVSGGSPHSVKQTMLRGLGPRLAPYGIAQPLADPNLVLHYGNGGEEAKNDNWKSQSGFWSGVETATIMNSHHLSSLEGYEKDSAIVRALMPGAHTIVISSANGGTGTALVEAYELNIIY